MRKTKGLVFVMKFCLFFRMSCYGWWFLFALGVVADVCWLVFIWSCSLFFCTHLLFSPGYCFFSLGGPRPPTYTHPPTLQRFFALTRIAWRWSIGGWWVVLVGRRSEIPPTNWKWLHFGYPGKSTNLLPFDFVHNPVWELHTSAATPPSLLFSVASTTNLVGHNIFASFVDRHKT